VRVAHTPGPWVAVKSTAHADNPESRRVDIVTMGTEFSPSFVAGDILPEDARLIASAPEMLDVLRDVLDWYANTTEGDMPPELHTRVVRAVGGEVAP
jgi:hypothetical protein